jgi:hypothetical protein
MDASDGVFRPDGAGDTPNPGVMSPLPPMPYTNPPLRPSIGFAHPREQPSVAVACKNKRVHTRNEHVVPE